jgi:hypothetical protein
VSTPKREVVEQVKDGKSMGVMEAAKEGVQVIAPGLSLSNILSDIGSELGRLGVQGQAELASALFTSNAYVPYGRGQNPIDKGIEGEEMQKKHEEQSREMGGREM